MNAKQSKMARYAQFFLIVLAAGAIFPVIYLRTSYQETILQVYQIELSDLNRIYQVLGWVFVIGYFPSGLLSDKFSAKWLLVVSLLGTAIGGFWFAQVPSYGNIIVIFCIWGIFSVFTFWAAHMKLVKLLAKKEEEGRFFGILDGGRGAVEALLATAAVVIFAVVQNGATAGADAERQAIVSVVYLYSGVVLLAAVLCAIFITEPKERKTTRTIKENSGKTKEKLDLPLLFRNQKVFLMGGIIFLTYSVYWTIYYLGGFLQTNHGVDAVTVGVIMAVALWMRPLAGTLVGFFADGFTKTLALTLAVVGAIACLMLLVLLPSGVPSMVVFVFVVACAFFLYAIRGSYWSLLGDCDIHPAITGVAIGLISLIGYMPDILLPGFNSFLFATFGDTGGYLAYFLSSAGMGAIGIFLILIFKKMTATVSKTTSSIDPVSV